jgi:hypothetical protein
MQVDWKKVEGFAEEEMRQFLGSKTVKALVGIELASLAAFAQGVVAGSQPLTLESLKGWLLLQAGIVIACLIRHTFAGIEAKLSFAPQVVVKAAEATAQATLLATLAKKDPALEGSVRKALAAPDPLAAAAVANPATTPPVQA